MSARPLFALWFVFAVSAYGQTAADMSAKYPVVSAYELRPEILMTARYSEDGQVCEITLEKRHYTPEEIDLSSTIPSKLVEELIDELVPATERGPATSPYLRNSYVGHGISDLNRDFQNVAIQVVGSTSESCNGGDEVVIIRWKKRTCEAPKPAAVETTKESR